LRLELLRTLAALVAEIDRGLEHGVLSLEDVHDLHRDMRRVASGLAVWGRLVPAGRQEATQEIVRRLRRLARLVGRVRDRDVTTELFTPSGRRDPRSRELAPWHEFLGRLRDDTDTGRELLRAFLRTERQAGLFDRARSALETTPRPDAAQGLQRILGEERRLRQGKVRKAHRRARRRPTSERLHRLRIRIRQWRHLASLEVAARATAAPPPPSWQRLQDRLGRLHDLDVALATVPEELVDLSPPQRLRTTRHQLRESVRTSLDRIAERPARMTARARARGRQ